MTDASQSTFETAEDEDRRKFLKSDALLFETIEHLAALWTELDRLDAILTKSHRGLHGNSGGGADDVRAIEVQERKIFDQIHDFEWRILHGDVHTRAGFAAKCRALLDADVINHGEVDGRFLSAFVVLGRQAERLGITKAPNLRRRGALEAAAAELISRAVACREVRLTAADEPSQLSPQAKRARPKASPRRGGSTGKGIRAAKRAQRGRSSSSNSR